MKKQAEDHDFSHPETGEPIYAIFVLRLSEKDFKIDRLPTICSKCGLSSERRFDYSCREWKLRTALR
jgi:hypothetical protein